MSADRLRAAATLLRERAEQTTRGAAWTEGHYWVEDYDPNDLSGQTSMQVEIGGMGCEGDALYYSMMAPPVALALADWLDVTASKADDVESSGLTFGGVEGRPALALADAILGGTE